MRTGNALQSIPPRAVLGVDLLTGLGLCSPSLLSALSRSPSLSLSRSRPGFTVPDLGPGSRTQFPVAGFGSGYLSPRFARTSSSSFLALRACEVLRGPSNRSSSTEHAIA